MVWDHPLAVASSPYPAKPGRPLAGQPRVGQVAGELVEFQEPEQLEPLVTAPHRTVHFLAGAHPAHEIRTISVPSTVRL